MENMSLSDIAAVAGKDHDFDGGGIWWILILIVLMGGGNWGLNNRTDGSPVTEAGLCNAMNFNNLENAVGRLSDQNQVQTATLNDAVLNEGFQNQQAINNLGKDVALAQANIQTQAATNQGDTQRAIDSVKYEVAQDVNTINANTTAQVQKVMDLIQQNKIDALQARVNQLETENQLQTVVRFPTSTTYGAGWNPFFNPAACNCGTNF